MNARLCKALRKAVGYRNQAATPGTYTYPVRGGRTFMYVEHFPDGTRKFHEVTHPGTGILLATPNNPKGMYRALKKRYGTKAH